MLNKRTFVKRLSKVAAAVTALGTMAIIAIAQDFPTFSGSPSRAGIPVDVNAGLYAPNVYNDSGRNFLRWWDPVSTIRATLDNDEISATGRFLLTGTWNDATPLNTVAFNYYQRILGVPIYRYASLTKATSDTNPAQGQTAAYSFVFQGLSATSNYETYINLPVGPTDVGNPVPDFRFPQKYWVVQITNVQGGPYTEVIDYDVRLGGFVRLGNAGQEASRTFQPLADRITISLLNTAPINANGTFLDPRLTADPTLLSRQVVYADGARIVSQGKQGTATYTSTPIVHQLQAPPIGGGPEAYPVRTVASRNQEAIIGELNRKYNFGVTSSYNYHGVTVPSAFQFRFNKIWDFPVRRPYDNSEAETTRFATEARDWVMAAGKNRTDQQIQVDNLNGGASFAPPFFNVLGTVDNIGPTYLSAPAISGNPTGDATFGTNLPEAKYFIQVWLPGNGALANQVQVEVLQGGTVVDTLELDQRGPKGWKVIPFQIENGYQHTEASPLTVRITNHTGDANSVGASVYADAVRFVRQADLGVDSTSVQTTTSIQTGTGPANRDVTIVAMENGRLYCMDAHGDPATGAPPTVYWTYPTEGGTDPNSDVTEDGKDRIAEMPYGFDLSSALVTNVGGVDLLYIASKNGKIYCIEISGRGDGTARRRWTFPDDYDPTQANLPMAPGLRPITGSVAFGMAGATPVIIVPTMEGRIYALDASGTPATKKTSIVWQYPPAINNPLGEIRMTPIVAFGRVFFGTQDSQVGTAGHVYALNMADGTLAWDQDGAGIGGFDRFRNSSPVAVPGAMLAAPAGTWDNTTLDQGNDRVFVADSAGKFASLDPVDGSIEWSTTELTTGASGPLRFGFSTQFDNSLVVGGTLQQNVPMVYVSDLGGRITGLSAVGQRNKAGTYKIWGFKMAGNAQVATLATGGYNPANGNPHSWLYTGDSAGNLYAFNSIDDNNVIPLLPGDPPGEFDPSPNDPGIDELNNAIDANSFKLISPEAYDRLREMADDPLQGVGTGEIDAIVNGDADVAYRRHFDFGETLYVLVYNLPNGSGSNAGYYLDFEISSAGRAPQHRQQPLRQYDDDGSRNFALLGLTLMTNGVGGVGPGPNFVTARAVAPGNRNLQGTPVHLPKSPGFVPPQECDFYLANPLGIAFLSDTGFVNSSVCLDPLSMDPRIEVDPANARWGLYNRNGNAGTDQDPTGVSRIEPLGPLGPDLRSKGQPIAHGSTGVQQLYVVDRSLMSLVLGRGLSGVRVGPKDLAWVKDLIDPTGGVYKPLSANGLIYPGFEDYPLNVPNTSVDYPDVARESLAMTSNLFGQAQNPLYVSGVDLNAPTWTQQEFANYRMKANFDQQMVRRLSPTIFEMNLDVPKYQPPSANGYYGSQVIFVDYQAGNPNFDPTQGSYRTFGLGLSVAVDEHVVFRTPTIDVGSMPSGGGFHGGVAGGPLNPWDPATLLSPWNLNFNNMFQPFTIANEGNVNLLNVRTAKYFTDANGARPVELFMPGQHELAWIDASLHLHTSLDPRFSASRLVGAGSVGFDPLARNILQKPRPRDLVGTRFNVNPKSRPNAGLKTAGGFLFDPNVIIPGDPKMGVTSPIGSPAGQYIRRIFAFEDDVANNVNADNPTLGNNEAFTDPGANLKFTVREGRITNSPSTKSAPMVESVLAGPEKFAFSNTQPTAMRDGLGNLFVAWSSNRVDAGNNPGWIPKPKLEGDLLNQDKWRVYVGSLRSILGNALGESPIGELNGWNANTNQRWFRQVLVIDPPASSFTLDPGETIDPASVKFGAPAFPSGGFFNQLDFPAQAGRNWFTGRYLTFIGEATKFDAAGNRTAISQVFLVPLVMNADGSIAYDPAQIKVSPIDTTSMKTQPSMTLTRQGPRDFATVYTTSFSNGSGQIEWHNYNSAFNNFNSGNLRLGSAFENMGAPSVALHRYRNANGQGRAHVTFTSKVKGRRNSEVYMVRLQTSTTGLPTGRNPVQAFGTNADPYIDELTSDPSTGVFWAPGLQWLVDQTALDQIDITTTPDGNNANSIWDQQTSTREFDVASGVLRFRSRLGGEVVIDTNTGAIRMTGAVLKRDTRLFLVYRPTIMRLTVGAGSNYRSVSTAYDDRFIGVRVNPTNPQRNLIGDLQYWMGNPNPATVNDPLRWDRTVLAYTRTSADGTAATRPFFQTMRFGIQLDHAIRTDANGQATFFNVNYGTGVAGEQFCQFDPATGRVFFMAGNEDLRVTVTYDPIDDAGNFLPRRTESYPVRLITEIQEQAVPIEQVGNESALSIALDPLNGTFNRLDPESGRRPGLLWFFWTSSRAGQPDVFFETVAPRFSPRRADQ